MKASLILSVMLAQAMATELNVITQFLPASGPFGLDIDVAGSGFANATGAQIGGVAAPFLRNSDTSVTISVPAGAVTGPITILDPDGAHVSATDFTVAARAPATPGEQTSAGREAIDLLVVVVAAKNRGDLIGLAAKFGRDVLLIDGGERERRAAPSSSMATPAEIAAHQVTLASYVPASLGTEPVFVTVLGGGGVLVSTQDNGTGKSHNFLVRNSLIIAAIEA